MNRFILGIVATTALVPASIAPASAGSVILALTRTNLTNVTDTAGTWQIETGTVAHNSAAAGQYEIERRVSTGGVEAQNTAAVRVTLFLATSKGGAPENIVLMGSHSFASGAFNGSVAAASTRYAYLRDADATAPSAGVNYNMTITWTGIFPFAIP